MVYIYLPAAYYHLNLDVKKENLLVAGFSHVPSVFLVIFVSLVGTCFDSMGYLAVVPTDIPVHRQDQPGQQLNVHDDWRKGDPGMSVGGGKILLLRYPAVLLIT